MHRTNMKVRVWNFCIFKWSSLKYSQICTHFYNTKYLPNMRQLVLLISYVIKTEVEQFVIITAIKLESFGSLEKLPSFELKLPTCDAFSL